MDLEFTEECVEVKKKVKGFFQWLVKNQQGALVWETLELSISWTVHMIHKGAMAPDYCIPKRRTFVAHRHHVRLGVI